MLSIGKKHTTSVIYFNPLCHLIKIIDKWHQFDVKEKRKIILYIFCPHTYLCINTHMYIIYTSICMHIEKAINLADIHHSCSIQLFANY